MVSPSAFFSTQPRAPHKLWALPQRVCYSLAVICSLLCCGQQWVGGLSKAWALSSRTGPSKGTLQLRWQRRKDRAFAECLLTGHGVKSTESSPGSPLGNNQVCSSFSPLHKDTRFVQGLTHDHIAVKVTSTWRGETGWHLAHLVSHFALLWHHILQGHFSTFCSMFSVDCSLWILA